MDTRITTGTPHGLQRGDRIVLHTPDDFLAAVNDWNAMPGYVVNASPDYFTFDFVSPQVWRAGWLLERLLVFEGVALAVVAAALWWSN